MVEPLRGNDDGDDDVFLHYSEMNSRTATRLDHHNYHQTKSSFWSLWKMAGVVVMMLLTKGVARDHK